MVGSLCNWDPKFKETDGVVENFEFFSCPEDPLDVVDEADHLQPRLHWGGRTQDRVAGHFSFQLVVADPSEVANLHVHQQVGLLNEIHHLANLLYHHHHYNSGIVPREALHN